MYRNTERQMTIYDFILPFSGKLDSNNRWVKMADIIPWDEIEEKYSRGFSYTGKPAKPVRMALGALIIKERCGYSDEETVRQIIENPYLQYFLGLPEFTTEQPFDPSLMVWFRKRLNNKVLSEINELICGVNITMDSNTAPDDTDGDNDDGDNDDGDNPGNACGIDDGEDGADAAHGNEGILILDATCAPADIKFPTDLGLLNEAREKLEAMIDALHEARHVKRSKPRTYRKNARKDYLKVAKQKKPGAKKIRGAIRKQLGYVARDLKHVHEMIAEQGPGALTNKQQTELSVIQKLHEQQSSMFKRKVHRIADRIVSISQSHVRPIVRGKAKATTEFGAKLAISLADGYAYIEHLAWDNFNEGGTLKETVMRYKERRGHFPEAVLADKLYRTRENLKFCKENGIRLSGPKLGRPSKIPDKAYKRQEYEDARQRNAVEGKFGEGKRSYGLDRIMAKLKNTSESVISMQFIVMNLERKLRLLISHFTGWHFLRIILVFEH